METCRLCGAQGNLSESHITPAFVVRWLKDTGATPYLRSAISPNKRTQDVPKVRLLCQSCETLFSQDEGIFAREIFQPYVEEELDTKGHGQGRIKEFKYDKWLLRFAISLQWRVVATRNDREDDPVLESFEKMWQQFLIGARPDTGTCETHLIFLRSLATATKSPELELGEKVNMYILRSVDATTVSSRSGRCGVYSKLGPMAFFTSLKPRKLKGNSDSRVHMRGRIRTGQKLSHTGLNNFIFITRPNDVFSRESISDKQNTKISEEIVKNPVHTMKSLSFHAYEADVSMQRT